MIGVARELTVASPTAKYTRTGVPNMPLPRFVR